MKKIFITGSCGFFLSNFIRKAIHFKLDYKISSIDIINKSHILNNVFQNKNHSFNIGSCSDKHLLNILFMSDKPDVIIHGAFNDIDVNNNLIQTATLLEECKNHNIKKFVFLSSSEVYGDGKNNNLSENFMPMPITDVGVIKSVSEDFVKKYCTLHDIEYTIVRVADFFGPRQSKSKFIVDSFYKLKNNKEVLLTNNGNNLKDWGHVVDGVNGLIKIIDNGNSNDEYNLSRGFHLTELEILLEFCKILGFNNNLIKISNSNKQINSALDNSKLKALGWEPEIDLQNSIEYFSKWYVDNNWWFKE